LTKIKNLDLDEFNKIAINDFSIWNCLESQILVRRLHVFEIQTLTWWADGLRLIGLFLGNYDCAVEEVEGAAQRRSGGAAQ
jgi:hypothetical protein